MRFDTKFKVYLAVFGTTVVSVAMSLVITMLIMGGPGDLSSMAPAIAVPLCVAPLVSLWGFTQAHKIELLNKELAQLLNHDPLTQTHSRSYFFDAADASKPDSAAVVLMVDADHFKAINDTYGHQIGDRALQHISELISEHSRKTDVVARLGGEEFGIYMPDTEIATAQLVAERIRIEICNTPLMIDGHEIYVSASIGVALRNPGEQVEAALKRADVALYQAKSEGRNQVKVDRPAATAAAAARAA